MLVIFAVGPEVATVTCEVGIHQGSTLRARPAPCYQEPLAWFFLPLNCTLVL